MQVIGSFIQNQILGMKWLNSLLGSMLTGFGLDTNTRIGGSVLFFIYDVFKITILLCVLIFLISYIQSYFPPERSRKILGGFHGILANCIGALLGTVTPFCSCSSIPLFIGFTSAGLPLGVTFSFLISSPMVDLGSLLLLMSIFGTKVAVIYVILGLAIAVAGGTLIEHLHMEKYVEDFIYQNNSGVNIESPELTFKDRLDYAEDQVVSTFKKVFPYILIGVGIGAMIHNWIPEGMGGESSRKRKSAGRDISHDHRDSHVCGHLRNDSNCGGTAVERSASRRRTFLYDGGDNAFSSVTDHVAESCEAKASRDIHRNLHCWNYHRRILF